jgi:hypothetical protein
VPADNLRPGIIAFYNKCRVFGINLPRTTKLFLSGNSNDETFLKQAAAFIPPTGATFVLLFNFHSGACLN